MTAQLRHIRHCQWPLLVIGFIVFSALVGAACPSWADSAYAAEVETIAIEEADYAEEACTDLGSSAQSDEPAETDNESIPEVGATAVSDWEESEPNNAESETAPLSSGSYADSAAEDPAVEAALVDSGESSSFADAQEADTEELSSVEQDGAPVSVLDDDGSEKQAPCPDEAIIAENNASTGTDYNECESETDSDAASENDSIDSDVDDDNDDAEGDGGSDGEKDNDKADIGDSEVPEPSDDPLPAQRKTVAYAAYDDESGTLSFSRLFEGDLPDRVGYALYSGFEEDVYELPDDVPWAQAREGVMSVVFLGGVAPKSTANWFAHFNKLVSFDDAGYLDMSGASSANGMFMGCTMLESVNMEGWDVGALSDIDGMFQGCDSLRQVNGFQDVLQSLQARPDRIAGYESFVAFGQDRLGARVDAPSSDDVESVDNVPEIESGALVQDRVERGENTALAERSEELAELADAGAFVDQAAEQAEVEPPPIDEAMGFREIVAPPYTPKSATAKKPAPLKLETPHRALSARGASRAPSQSDGRIADAQLQLDEVPSVPEAPALATATAPTRVPDDAVPTASVDSAAGDPTLDAMLSTVRSITALDAGQLVARVLSEVLAPFIAAMALAAAAMFLTLLSLRIR